MSGSHEHLQNSQELVSKKEVFEDKLLTTWLDLLSRNQVSEIRSPIINREQLLGMLQISKRTQHPIVIVAIGCQDWIKPEWGDPRKDRLMGRISPQGKRAGRFTQEMAKFSQALSSFQIPHRIHFSLSDIEALIHMELQNMGLEIHNPDPELLAENVIQLADKIQSLGGQISPFIHSQRLHKLLQTPDLRSYQQRVAQKTNPTYREFLDRQYEIDLGLLANTFVGPNEVGPIWLDIQSFNFEDDVRSFEATVRMVSPQMPVLSILPNAGNWHGRLKPMGTFPTRDEVLASLMRFEHLPQDQTDWVRKLRKAKNEPLEQLISEIFAESFMITNAQQKTLAVRLLCLLAFGMDPLENHNE